MLPKLPIATETLVLCKLEGVEHTQWGVTEYIPHKNIKGQVLYYPYILH